MGTVPGSVSGIGDTHCVIPLTNGTIRMMYYTDADHGSEKKSCEAEAMVCTQSLVLYSLSGKTSYRQISWSLEAARLDVAMVVSLWNLTGTSAALSKTESRGFETSRDLAVRPLTA